MLLAAQDSADSVTALDIATLVIALVGAFTGIASLVWNIASHRLTGARVRVELLGGWRGSSGVRPVRWSSFDPSDGPPTSEYLNPVVAVRVRNVGRLPASVTSWYVNVGMIAYGPVEHPDNKPLPHRLEGGEENTWFLDFRLLDAVVLAMTNTNMPLDHLTAKVVLGSGVTIESQPEPVVPLIIVDRYDPPMS